MATIVWQRDPEAREATALDFRKIIEAHQKERVGQSPDVDASLDELVADLAEDSHAASVAVHDPEKQPDGTVFHQIAFGKWVPSLSRSNPPLLQVSIFHILQTTPGIIQAEDPVELIGIEQRARHNGKVIVNIGKDDPRLSVLAPEVDYDTLRQIVAKTHGLGYGGNPTRFKPGEGPRPNMRRVVPGIGEPA